MKYFENMWLTSVVSGIALTLLSFIVGKSLGWFDVINWLEVFAVFTSFVCTILCNYQSRWNYPIGIISQIALFILTWQAGLYAVATFNLYLVASLTYGFFFWRSDDNTIPVTYATNWLGYATFGLALAAVYYGVVYFIQPEAVATVSKIEVWLAAMSGIAQLLLDRKKIQTWGIWALINVVSIPFYISVGLYFVAFQYMFFLVNTYIGYRAWKKTIYYEDTIILNERTV
jgi:nicotinamide mononucleotide transporter